MSPCDKIKQLVSNGWKLIDVREPHEYNSARIENALNVRLTDVHRLPADKYIVYCQSGARSGAAAGFLISQGAEAVNAGGINQYIGCIQA